jgi:hypothetical protein
MSLQVLIKDPRIDQAVSDVRQTDKTTEDEDLASEGKTDHRDSVLAPDDCSCGSSITGDMGTIAFSLRTAFTQNKVKQTAP